MERAKRSTATFRFCFVLLVGRKINLWTEVFARSFSRNNFSFAFQENGEKCASYCGGFQRAFIALALIVSVILESFKLSYFFSFSFSSCFSSSFSSSYHHLFPPRNTKKKKKKEEGEQKREIKRYSRVRTSRSALSSRGSLMKQYEWLWRYGGAHKSILRMLEDSSQLSIYRIDFSRRTRRIDYRLISSARWKSIVIFHRPRRFQRGRSISTIYIPISISLPLSLPCLSPFPTKKNIFQFLLPTTSLFFWANSLWFWFCGVFGTRLRTATATTTIYHQLQLNNYNSTA